jgi:hypothetical protein
MQLRKDYENHLTHSNYLWPSIPIFLIVMQGNIYPDEKARLDVDDNRAKLRLAKARVVNLEKRYERERRLFRDGIILKEV